MSNDIKRFIKSAAIVAAAALSGSHANAQPKETNAADQHIQYMQTNEPKYSFDDDRCSNLLEFVVAESGRSQSECTSMLRKYIAEMNKFYSKDQKAYNLTMSDYTNVLKDIGCNSVEVVKGKKAFMQMMQEQENTYQVQIRESSHRSFDSPVYAVDDGNISYYTDKGIFHISGSFSGNINHLMPQLYQTSDGKYTCGSLSGSDRDFLMQSERIIVRDLAKQHLVYKDILKRQENGDRLLPAEKDFVQVFFKDLAKEGLSIDTKGNLKQKDPRYKPNTLSNSALKQSSR